jgi:hypothetical protein
MRTLFRGRFRHGVPAVAGVAAFALILLYTGTPGVWLGAQCGLAVALILYLYAHMRDSDVADGGS